MDVMKQLFDRLQAKEGMAKNYSFCHHKLCSLAMAGQTPAATDAHASRCKKGTEGQAQQHRRTGARTSLPYQAHICQARSLT
eukprot:scaffold102057_cov22-Tisochrysis_lutea.AAC.3